ncbi:MAG: DUF11 domain-containing protein [Solirubrobacterales bacterium]|nr:DUF11 domain-containing protein [Solirubrobacterales bacterium]
MNSHFTLRRSNAAIAAALTVVLALFAVLAATSQGAPKTGSADLSITKTDAKDPVQPGAPIDYTIVVTNSGPDVARNVVVTDKLPQGTTFVSATTANGTCAIKGNTVTCNLGDLTAGGASDTATITLRVTAPTSGGTITNTADVASDTGDPNNANNTATQNTTVAGGNGNGGGARTCLGSKATIVGTRASETLVGTGGRDVIFGAGGADLIRGLGGKDLLCGAGGRDKIKGGAGSDRISGAGGRDRLSGGGGNDLVKGGKRADKLLGGSGNDRLSGGKGNDSCAGGPGKDVERSC